MDRVASVDARRLGLALLGFATGVLLLAYLAICVRLQSWWPWDRVVHEEGRRTLLETLFYFEHAARELPLDLLLGAGVGAGAVFALGSPARARSRAFGLALVAVVLGIVAGVVATAGVAGLMDNLLQRPTRSGTPLAWGAHWRYHLLSRLSLLLLAFGFAGFVESLGFGRSYTCRSGAALFVGVLGVFAVGSFVFAGDGADLLRIFDDPLHLGHQARELATHGLVTLPLAWGLCLLLAASSGTSRRAVSRATLAAAALGTSIAVFLVAAAIATDAASRGQSDSLVVLLAPHVFEHGLGYLLAPCAAAVVFTSASARAQATAR